MSDYDDDDILAQLAMEQGKVERLRLQVEGLILQRETERLNHRRVVEVLANIHGLLYPPLTKTPDGKTWAFRPDDPHEWMQAISDRIREIPDEIIKEWRNREVL